MKRIEFSAKGNRSGNLLRIETDGAVINVRVGLTDRWGQAVTSVEILADNYAERGGTWDLDGHVNSRLIQRHNCAVCGGVLVPGDDNDTEDNGIYHRDPGADHAPQIDR